MWLTSYQQLLSRCITYHRCLRSTVTPAPDLDVGAWGPGVVGSPMCGYKMFMQL